MAKTPAAQLKATEKYQQQNIIQIKFKLNTKADADILAKLDSVDNKQGYIKDLIREAIKKDQA